MFWYIIRKNIRKNMIMKKNELKSKNVVKTEKLEVGDNIFKYDHAVIQLSNISYFDVLPMPAMNYPLWIFVVGFIGFILVFADEVILLIIGLIAMAICAYVFYRIEKNNKNLGDYLILALNSGKTFYFSCYSKLFLYEVENVILQCFKDRNLKYSVDLKDCLIINQEDNMNIYNTGNIINGDNNTAHANNTGNIGKSETISDEEWKKLEDTFKEIVSKTDADSYEHMLATSAQYQIIKKDKMGLRKLIKENVDDFKSNIFSKVALGGIVEIIKKIIQ